MVSFGFGEIFGSVIIGMIIDKYGSKKASIYNVVMVFITIMVTLAFMLVGKYNWIAFAMTFMWGVQDSSTNTHCLEMLGFEFDNSADPFSVNIFSQSFAIFVF